MNLLLRAHLASVLFVLGPLGEPCGAEERVEERPFGGRCSVGGAL